MLEFLNKHKSTLISFGVGLIICLIILLINGCFKYESTIETIKDLCDGFSISGFLLISFGLMVFIGNEGTFSILSFGVKKLISLFTPNVYTESYYDHKKKRVDNKAPYSHLIISGLILFFIGMIFLIIFNNMYVPETLNLIKTII